MAVCYRQKLVSRSRSSTLDPIDSFHKGENLSDYNDCFPRFCRCGRCPACVSASTSGYIVRCYFEFKYSTFNNYFIGLSLDDKYYRQSWSPWLFFSRFRDRYRKKYGYFPSYLVCYEFSSKNTERLHYHLLLLDCKEVLSNLLLLELWQYGLVFIGDYFDIRSVLYATKYLKKSYVENLRRSVDMFRNVRTSNFFGLSGKNPVLLDEVRGFLLGNRLLTIGTKFYSIPRYYLRYALSESERRLLFLKNSSSLNSCVVRFRGAEYDLSSSDDFQRLRVLLDQEMGDFLSLPGSDNFMLYESYLNEKKKQI